MAEEQLEASGVQELIDKLRDDGVKLGEASAKEIIDKAQEEANQILENAKNEAKKLVDEADKRIELDKKNADEALKLAARDSLLYLELEIRKRIDAKLKNVIGDVMADRKFIEKVILSIAGKSKKMIAEDSAVELLLSERVDVNDESEDIPKDLVSFVSSLSSELLHDGISIVPHRGDPGINIQMKDENLDIQSFDEFLQC